MKTTSNKTIFSFTILLSICITSVCFGKNGFQLSNRVLTDSALLKSTAREVLTSQQLFVVKISPIKNGNTKPTRVNFKAELRDAYKIIDYYQDDTIVLTEWVMCPDGKCPIVGVYNVGTAGYKQLDSLIMKAKSQKLRSQKR